jgi:hypothetical protein
MKQTAVEYLAEQLDLGLSENGLKSVIQQAKEMEKKQIMDAANKLLYHSTGISDTAAEQYYKETFNK